MDSADEILSDKETLRAGAIRAPVDEMVGATLDGRYLIERKLGRGGFGDVYLASDNKVVSRKIVVKVMRPDETTGDWSQKKFKQELEALARINHPGIVDVFDCGETTDNRPYIVMEYIDGFSLRSFLHQEMSFQRVAGIVRQVGKALSAAHQAGILHRDLKPENIMVQVHDDEEHVKVIDFGVAKVKNSIVCLSTAEGLLPGTIAYMSPEQLSARPLTPATDIYSLSVIAYEMLTGQRPLNPQSVFQLLEMQRAGVQLKPGHLRPGLPEAAETIVLKALSFEPDDRYQSARDFGDLLAGALLGNSGQTKLNNRPKESPAESQSVPLETAHVLFVDIVSYSRLLIEEQTKHLRDLQSIVLATNECQTALSEAKLIRLPTGDGMALVFFTDPEAPVRCAVEISKALKTDPGIELRMGVHSGLVYRVADINTNMNVAGGGINLAQRVMDCGDGGHILLSKRVADDLGQLARWSSYLEDLGDAEVKHGLHVHLFNLYGSDFGNPERPGKLGKTSKEGPYKKRSLLLAAAFIIVGLVAAGMWYTRITKTTISAVNPTTPEKVVPTGPERSLTYWLTIQKKLSDKTFGPSIQSAGDSLYGNGWRFQFNLRPAQSGALYLLNVGPGKTQAEEYNILFPLPGAGRATPNLDANQTVQSDWSRFVDQTGVEKIWVIWSAHQIPALDEIFKGAVKSGGVIEDGGQIGKVQEYLKMYDSSKLQVSADKSARLTSIKGHGEIVVSLIELSHESY